MATQAITITYTDGETVAASMGCVVTRSGQFFYNFPSSDPQLIRRMCDFLRNCANDRQTQNHADVDGVTIADGPSDRIYCTGW